MNDDIVAFGPVRTFEEWKRRIGASVICPIDINLNVGSGLDTLEQSFVLALVIVAATPSNQESLERFRFRVQVGTENQ